MPANYLNHHQDEARLFPLQQPAQTYMPGAFPLAPMPYPPLINYAGSFAQPFARRLDLEDQRQRPKPASRFGIYFWSCVVAGIFILGCFGLFVGIVAEGAKGHMGTDTQRWVDEHIKRPIMDNLVVIVLALALGGLAVFGAAFLLCSRRLRK